MSVGIAIVGAGPYGISLAAHLSGRGVEHRIFGRPLATWEQHMPDGMFLKSEGFASSIDAPGDAWTLAAFCRQHGIAYADLGLPVPIDAFRRYGRWFQQELVPHLENDDVTEVREADTGFSLKLASGARATARHVVVATGISGFAHLPAPLRGLPALRSAHTYDRVEYSALRGQSVAVVGAGQSALETAALLREAGAEPQLLVRAHSIEWNPDPESRAVDLAVQRPRHLTPLGANPELWWYWKAKSVFHLAPERRRVRFVRRTLGPSGAWWLRARVAEVVPVVLGQKVEGARVEGETLVLELSGEDDDKILRVDHVLGGTGYRIDVDRLEFLSPELRTRIRRLASTPGAPRLSPRFESSVRGLYFIGLAAAHTFGPAMRFVCGSSFVSPRLAQHLARD